jgi:hypothetical protein
LGFLLHDDVREATARDVGSFDRTTRDAAPGDAKARDPLISLALWALRRRPTIARFFSPATEERSRR